MAKPSGLIVFVSTAVLAVLVSSANAQAAEKKSAESDELVTVTYSVADLVIPVEMDVASGRREKQATLEAELMRLICTTVAPETWQDRGGPATIQYFPLGMGLVVRQTPAIQEEVCELLRALRRLQDTEIAVQIMIISVSEEGLNRLPEAQRPDRTKSKAMIMDADEVRDFLLTLQGDQATAVMQAPKITMANGQRAKLAVGDTLICVTDVEVSREGDRVIIRPKKETVDAGVHCILRGVASVDRDMVSLALDMHMTGVEELSPARPVILTAEPKDGEQVETIAARITHKVQRLRVARTLKIPDGHTAVLYAGQVARDASPISVDRDDACFISCLQRWLGHTKPESPHFFVLATPRVIVNSEASQPVVPASTPIPSIRR